MIMVTGILSHEVKNFAEWKTQFESGEAMREKVGVKVTGVFSAVNNPNHVTVIAEFPSKEVLDGFMNNPILKADMEKGGVIGAPVAMVLNKH